MTTDELSAHLTEGHAFTMPPVAEEHFIWGLHHGLHVQAGRDGTEDHLHEVVVDSVPA